MQTIILSLPFLLEDLDLVEKEIQVTENINSKLSRYIIKDPFIIFWYRYVQKNMALLEMRQTSSVVRRIADDLSNLEGRVLEMIFKEKILARPPMEFDVAGSVLKNREGLEIDFLLASQKENRVHAYEIKRGKVEREAELHRLIAKTARLTFKSIKLHNP